jgi:hypothetical protein
MPGKLLHLCGLAVAFQLQDLVPFLYVCDESKADFEASLIIKNIMYNVHTVYAAYIFTNTYIISLKCINSILYEYSNTVYFTAYY